MNDLAINDLPWLVATGIGSEQELVVLRDLSTEESEPRYQPVLDYIRENGLELVEEKTLQDERMFSGQYCWLHYASRAKWVTVSDHALGFDAE